MPRRPLQQVPATPRVLTNKEKFGIQLPQSMPGNGTLLPAISDDDLEIAPPTPGVLDVSFVTKAKEEQLQNLIQGEGIRRLLAMGGRATSTSEGAFPVKVLREVANGLPGSEGGKNRVTVTAIILQTLASGVIGDVEGLEPEYETE